MARSSTGKQTGFRQALQEAAVTAAADALEDCGWTVLPTEETPFSDNVDLHILKGDRSIEIAVLATNRYGWVTAGSVSPNVRDGGPIFNRAASPQTQAEFVILATPARPVAKREIPENWRLFVLPVATAEAWFRRTVDHTFARPKADGSPREAVGPIDSFVGATDPDYPVEPPPGHPVDDSHGFSAYAEAFDQLNRFTPPSNRAL